ARTLHGCPGLVPGGWPHATQARLGSVDRSGMGQGHVPGVSHFFCAITRNGHCGYPRCGRRLLLLLVAFAATLVIGAPAANAAAGPLTISRITWNVVGLDSNSAGSGPNVYQVG